MNSKTESQPMAQKELKAPEAASEKPDKNKKNAIKTNTNWIKPKNKNPLNKQEPFEYTNAEESPYLFQKEKDLLNSWLKPGAVSNSNNNQKKISDFLTNKRAAPEIKKESKFDKKLKKEIIELIGEDFFADYNYLINSKVKKIMNSSLKKSNKKFLLEKYFQMRKDEEMFERLFNLIKFQEAEEKEFEREGIIEVYEDLNEEDSDLGEKIGDELGEEYFFI